MVDIENMVETPPDSHVSGGFGKLPNTLHIVFWNDCDNTPAAVIYVAVKEPTGIHKLYLLGLPRGLNPVVRSPESGRQC